MRSPRRLNFHCCWPNREQGFETGLTRSFTLINCLIVAKLCLQSFPNWRGLCSFNSHHLLNHHRQLSQPHASLPPFLHSTSLLHFPGRLLPCSNSQYCFRLLSHPAPNLPQQRRPTSDTCTLPSSLYLDHLCPSIGCLYNLRRPHALQRPPGTLVMQTQPSISVNNGTLQVRLASTNIALPWRLLPQWKVR